jgi:hypothetical protein
VILADRYEKEVEFFTFGGSVDMIPNSSALIYLFESTAPILELTSLGKTVVNQLAYEAQEIIGRMEEQWEEQHSRGFPERLTEIEPCSLYIAILNTILLRYEGAQALEEVYHALHSTVENERERLIAHDLWSDEPRRVEELVWSAV